MGSLLVEMSVRPAHLTVCSSLAESACQRFKTAIGRTPDRSISP
jgi:hypothetical protein